MGPGQKSLSLTFSVGETLLRSIGICTHLHVAELVGASLSISVRVSAERMVQRGAVSLWDGPPMARS